MKNLEINAVFVGEEIPSLNEGGGKVISVFQNTVNLCIRNRLITVTTKNILSPINVNLDLPDFLNYVIDFRKKVLPNEGVTVFNKYLKFWESGLVIRTSNSRIYSSRRELMRLSNSCNGLRVEDIKLIAQKYLKIASLVGKGIRSELHPYITEGALSIHDSLKNLSTPDIVVPVKALKYVGLGDGLTPEYDDFLGGLLGTLSSLLYLRKAESHLVIRNEFLNNTTPISRHLLSSLIKGEVNNLILNAVSAYCTNEPEVLLDKLTDFLQLGHSSGTYSGFGTVIALLLDHLLQRNNTPTLADDIANPFEDILEQILNPLRHYSSNK